MLTHFLRAMNRCRSLPCPMGVRDWEDPTGRMPEEASGPPMESEVPGTKINCYLEYSPSKQGVFLFKHGKNKNTYFFQLMSMVPFIYVEEK